MVFIYYLLSRFINFWRGGGWRRKCLALLFFIYLFIYLFIYFFLGGGGGIEKVLKIGRSTASVRQPTNFAFKCIQVFCGHRIIGLTISSIFFLLAIVENSR